MMLSFFLRRSNVNPTLAAIYLRVTINRERLTVGAVSAVCGLKLPKSILIETIHWDPHEERVKKPCPSAVSLNKAIDLCRVKLKKLLDQHEGYDLEMDALTVKNLFLGDGQVRPSFPSLMSEFLEERSKTGASFGTLKTYGFKFRPFTQFLTERNLLSRPADEFTPEQIRQYKTFLIVKRGNKDRSASKNCQVVKTLLIWARDSGRIKDNKLRDTKIKVDKTPNLTFMSQEELADLQKANLSPKLRGSADCYIFACYTGIAYSDLAALTEENVQVVQNVRCLVGKRNKTGTDFCVPITAPVQALIDKYGGVRLPLPELRKYNSRLQEAMHTIGVSKHISSHTARKTFADWYINELGLSEESTIVAMGQKDAKELRPYRQTRPKRLLNEFPEHLLPPAPMPPSETDE